MYNLETLTELTGMSRRTIRYYIQRELLAPPLGGGRGSYYTTEHREQLDRIKMWSEQGVPLIHMKAMMEGREIPTTVDRRSGVETVSWERCEIADGVELSFRGGLLSHAVLKKIIDVIDSYLEGEKDE